MAAWTDEELRAIGTSDELRISSRRRDGSLRPFVTIWVVRAGDDLYVRSAHGPANPWFVRARRSGAGRVRVAQAEYDVTFEEGSPDSRAQVDAAYHAKYDRYGRRFVGAVVSREAGSSTLRLVPSH